MKPSAVLCSLFLLAALLGVVFTFNASRASSLGRNTESQRRLGEARHSVRKNSTGAGNASLAKPTSRAAGEDGHIGRYLTGVADYAPHDPAALCREIWRHAALREGQRPRPIGWSDHWHGFERKGKPTHDKMVVAVGKSGGLTLMNLLEKKQLLGRFDWIHTHPVAHKTLADKTMVVMSVRDPLERFISAFRFLYTEKRHDHFTGTQGAQRNFFNCFWSLGKFVDSLDEDSLCGAKARASLVDNDMFRAHLNKGNCFYYGGLLDELAHKKLLVINVDSILADFNKLVVELHKPELALASSAEVPHKHDNNITETIEVNLSEKQRERLRQHIRFEYIAYDAIMSFHK